MRKNKKVKRKEVIFSLDEWRELEEKASQLSMKTGTFIKRMALDGKITYYNAKNVATIMNALRIIGNNINQVAKAETYFELIDKPDLSGSEQLRLKICKQTLENNNISERSDFDRLKTIQQEADKKITALKKSFENCKQMYETYSDIAQTYYDISKGDYISRLIEQEKEKEKSRPQNKSL